MIFSCYFFLLCVKYYLYLNKGMRLMNYIIISNSYHIIMEEVKKIVPNEDVIERIDFNDSSINEIINDASYTSMFNDKKYILVKNAEFLGSKSSTKTDKLEAYLKDSNPLTTLIFTSDTKVDERKKVVKLIKEQNNYFNIKNLTHKDIVDRVIKQVSNHKLKINYDDANYLTNKCLNNYDLVEMELDKVYLYYHEGDNVIRDTLEGIISSYLDDNNFKFVDAVVSNNYETSLRMLDDFKIEKVEPLALLSLIVREYRLMLYSKDLYQRGYSNRVIGEKLQLQDWQVEKLIKNSYNLSIRYLEDKMIELTDLDFKIKSGKIDKYLGMEMFILKEQ